MKKKTIALALVLVMAFGVTMGGTFAYLTSQTEVVTNTFTIGNVKITLDEVKVDVYGAPLTGNDAGRGTANTYKLIPGHTYVKDPTIHVTKGSEEAWLFVKVVDEIVDIQDTKTVAAQMAANGWFAVNGVDNVFAYNNKVDAREATEDIDIKVFENFKVLSTADVAAYAEKTITVQAYAIQADGFADAATAWAAAPATWTAPAQG